MYSQYRNETVPGPHQMRRNVHRAPLTRPAPRHHRRVAPQHSLSERIQEHAQHWTEQAAEKLGAAAGNLISGITRKRLLVTALGVAAAFAATKAGLDVTHMVSAFGVEAQNATNSLAEVPAVAAPAESTGDLLMSGSLSSVVALGGAALAIGIGVNRQAEQQYTQPAWQPVAHDISIVPGF